MRRVARRAVSGEPAARVAGRSGTNGSRGDAIACRFDAVGPRVQAKLTVNSPGDADEREADTVAERIMRMPLAAGESAGASIQRTCSACSAEHQPDGGSRSADRGSRIAGQEIQRHPDSGGGTSVGPAAAVAIQSAGPGAPLPRVDRAYFEPRFGHDFSGVRIHTGAAPAAAARHLSARAFTTGRNVMFGEGEYTPGTESGRRLLAHELVHVIQQERGRDPDVVRRRGPMARPAVRVQPRVRTGVRIRTGERYAEVPDDSLEGIFRRATRQAERELAIAEGERPVATLERGGSAPDFVTVGAEQTAVGEFGEVTYRDHSFHILDAIEYEVARARSEEGLRRVLERYIPAPIDFVYRPGRYVPVMQAVLPLIPENMDPGGRRRLAVYRKAARRRAREVPSLRASPATPLATSREARRRGCRVRPMRGHLGGDPLATLYCQAATGGLFEYEVISPTYGRVVFDAMLGDTVYECKCGYQSLLDALYLGKRWATRRLDRLDEQMLRHQRIAQDCGLWYRFMVSNRAFAAFLRSRWSSTDIVHEPYEPCD